MQKFILSIVFVLFSLTVTNAQSKFTVGLGASGSLFVPSENHLLDARNSILPHLHFQYEPFSVGRFSGQIQANFYSKQIGLYRSYDNDQGGTTVEGFHYQHLATDLVLSVLYNQPVSENVSFRPRIGYFFSFNHFMDATQRFGVFGGGSTNSSGTTFGLSEPSAYFHPGIMAGFSFDRIKNRSISLFADVYLTPRDIFNDPLTFLIDGQQEELQGKFHYLNVGIRYGLDKL